VKVLIVITKSEIGGAQVFVLNLARSLFKMGCDVHVAAGDGDYLEEELRKSNITFHYLNSLKRNVSLLNSLYFIFDLYRLLRIEKYDLIHLNSSNTLIGSISAYLLRKKPKIVFTFHGLSFLDENFKIKKVFKFFAKLYFDVFLKTIDRTVFVSKLNYKESKEANVVKYGEVIYNGLDEKEMNLLNASEARVFFTDKCKTDLSNSFLIGSTGRLAYQKNYEFLINNFLYIKKKIPNAKIVIIGDGPDRVKYKEQIIKFGITDDFFLIGALKDSYKYIKAFDVFTLPSRYEGLSISLIEAIFAKIPILASNVGGNSEVVGGDLNQLYKFDDINDYVEKLLGLKNNKEHSVKNNSFMKGKFLLGNMVRDYWDLYNSLLDNV
jgi:glycosyltransferase involved in cell wall biosynthesis